MGATVAVVVIELRVEDVDGGEHALFADRHGLVVQSRFPRTLQIGLAHVGLAALHQVRLDGRNVVQLLQLDAVVDNGCEQWIALRVIHRHVVLSRCPRLHQLRFFVRHGL